MSEAEVVKDIATVLARVRQGAEVVVEEGHRAVAFIGPPRAPGRKLSECIALAKAYEERLGDAPLPDSDFAKDLEAAVNAHRDPLAPPAWE